jgi:hypothetical protein
MTSADPHGALVEDPQQRELVVATDERCVRPARQRIGTGHDAHERVSREGMDLPPGVDRPGRPGLDRRSHQPFGRLAEQHLVRLGGLLQPRGHVHRITRDQRLAGPDHDLAGVHTDPARHPHGPGRVEVAAELDQGRAHLLGGAHRPERVVLVQVGQPEDGHHRVADELLDGAAVPLDSLAHPCVVGRHHAAQHLRVEPVAERRRAHEVAEEHRHGPARLRDGRSGKHGSAPIAEPGVARILTSTPAARDACHPRRIRRRRIAPHAYNPPPWPTCS